MEISQSVNIEKTFVFYIWNHDLEVIWPKEEPWVKQTLKLTIKTCKTKVKKLKWPPIKTCNMILDWSQPRLYYIVVMNSKQTCLDGVTRLQSFETLCVLVSRTHLKIFKKIGHFNAISMVSHKAYYKGGSGESSQI